MKYFWKNVRIKPVSKMKSLCLKKQKLEAEIERIYRLIDTLEGDNLFNARSGLYDYIHSMRMTISEIDSEIFALEYR